MRIAPLRLQQRDGRTCGPSVAVVAGVLLDPGYRTGLSGGESGRAWFADEQLRVHALVNRIWPRALGTTPMGMARALTAHSGGRGVHYRWRMWRGRRDTLGDVLDAVGSHLPVAMLVGRFIPRHWVLIVDESGAQLQCYEPSSGDVRTVGLAEVRQGRLTGLGYPRPFAFVLPRNETRSATA